MSAGTKPIGVIVDAYSSGSKLAPRFQEYDFRLIHVQSRPDAATLDQSYFCPSDFDQHLTFDGDFDALTERLRGVSPQFVLSGGEYGIELADQLAQALRLPGNRAELSVSRRNKHAMARQLERCGLAHGRSIEVASLTEARNAVANIGSFPVVLKPVNSAGSDGVHFCEDDGQLAAAFEALFGRINDMGLPNTSLLIMEYIRGTQYLVHSNSRDGVHHIFEIWIDYRPVSGEFHSLYELILLLPAHGHVQSILASYARKCLDALGVRFGPASLEIKLTESGPILIDVASRLTGDQDYVAIKQVTGLDALSLCVASYADPGSYNEIVAAPAERHGHIGYVGACSHEAGCVTSDAWTDDVRALPSFQSIGRAPRIGDRLVPTIDLATLPAFVWLVADSRDDLIRDYRRLRDLERRPGGLYRVDPG